ncbi:hypothetical protein FRB95_002637 [Tulasnella sp. JGI-2019a]|nr:hypothetical protein FRB95_002637 [Tulasnella sp. JGI-2019a]
MNLFSSHNPVVVADVPGSASAASKDFNVMQASSTSLASQTSTPTKSPRKLFGGLLVSTASMNTRNWRRRSSSLAIDGTREDGVRAAAFVEHKTMSGSTSRRARKSHSNSLDDELPGPSVPLAGSSPRRDRPSSGYDTDKDLPRIPPERHLPVITTFDLLNKPTPKTPSEEHNPFHNRPSGSSSLVPATVIITPSTPTGLAKTSFAHNISETVMSSAPGPSVSFASPLQSSNGRSTLTASDKTTPTVRRTRSFARDKKADSGEERKVPVTAPFSGIFATRTAPDPKGKGKAKELAWPTESSGEVEQEKTLTRKSSFWARTRNRVDSSPLLSNSNRPTVTAALETRSSEQTVRSPIHRSVSASSFHTRKRSKSFNGAMNAPSIPSFRPTSPLSDFLKPSSPTPLSAPSRRSHEKVPKEPPDTSSSSIPSGSRSADASPAATRSTPRIVSPRGSRTQLRDSQDSISSAASSSQTRSRAEMASPPMTDSIITSRVGKLSLCEQSEVTPWDTMEDLAMPNRRPSWTQGQDHDTPQVEEPASDFREATPIASPPNNTGPPKLALSLDSLANRRRSRSLFGLGSSKAYLELPQESPSSGFRGSRPGTPVAVWPSSSDPSTPTPISTGTSGSETAPGVTVTRTPSGSSSLSSGIVARQRFQRSRSTRSKTITASNQPQLLHRLSQNFFPSSTATGLHASRSASTSSLVNTSHSPYQANSSLSSRQGSPIVEPSRKNSNMTDGVITAASSSSWVPLPPPHMPPPKPRVDEETPEAFLSRLMEVVSKADLAGILASSSDDFYTRTLCSYMSRFDFTSDALDVALRKLLMDLSLPKETQQIDRVMEAFARRYDDCNPGLFLSNDHPYIIAFSLMMLHTDAFNRSNKRKMTKADYIKNTRLPGLAPEVLDCFYDNIVFAPFIFIEDPIEVNGARGSSTEAVTAPILSAVAGLGGGPGGVSPAPGVGGSNMFGQTKIDPYYLITRNLLIRLRAEVEGQIPQDNPYLYTGTAGAWDERSLQLAFAHARPLKMPTQPSTSRRRGSLPLNTLVGEGTSPETSVERSPAVTLKVIILGVLNRKDDVLEGGRRAPNRKWKEWGVLLTGSQLLFFRDSSLVTNALAAVSEKNGPSGRAEEALSMPSCQPDEVLNLRDSVALYDTSYGKYPNAFRMFLPGGRQFLMHAPSEEAMNRWISRINYACAFKSAGVRARPVLMDRDQAMSTGTAAAISHMNDVRRRRLVSTSATTAKAILPYKGASSSIAEAGLQVHPDESSDADRTLYNSSNTLNGSSLSIGSAGGKQKLLALGSASSLDLESPTAEPLDRRLEDTFFEVKAELAAVTMEGGEAKVQRSSSCTAGPAPRSVSLGSLPPDDWNRQRLSSEELLSKGARRDSRTSVIGQKLKELEERITSAQSALDPELRIACNLAVLTPFQASTRDRLVQAIPPLAKKITTLRMDMARLVCYRDVLYSDMVAEEREWHETVKVALHAGASFLKERAQGPNGVIRSPSSPLSGVSPRRSDDQVTDGLLSPGLSSTWRPNSSSVRGSLYSVASSSTDDPGNQSIHIARKPSIASIEGNSDGTKGDGSGLTQQSNSSPDLKLDRDVSPLRQVASANAISQSMDQDLASPASSTLGNGKPSMPTIQEQCEDWDKTRAAKRVSLALLPSDRKLTALSLLGRHCMHSPAEEVLKESAEDGI